MKTQWIKGAEKMKGQLLIGGVISIGLAGGWTEGASASARLLQLEAEGASAADISSSENDAASRAFRMTIEDVFSISGRGTVVTGRIESGTLRVGDAINIMLPRGVRRTRVRGIEMFRRVLTSAHAGDNVGILLEGIARREVWRGIVLESPGGVSGAGRGLQAVPDVPARMREVIVEHLGVYAARLRDEARFAEDLGADSLDVVELVMAAEEEFGIGILDDDMPCDEAERMQTVGDLIRYVEAGLEQRR